MSTSNPVSRRTTIFEGSILNAPSKNILVSIGENCILQGETAKALLARFWQDFQEELLQEPPFKRWEVRQYTRAEYNIFLGRPFDYDIRQLTILGVEACIREALQQCDATGLDSIAISALSSRYVPNNGSQINAIAKLALETYFEQHPGSCIKNIFLVNYNETVFVE